MVAIGGAPGSGKSLVCEWLGHFGVEYVSYPLLDGELAAEPLPEDGKVYVYVHLHCRLRKMLEREEGRWIPGLVDIKRRAYAAAGKLDAYVLDTEQFDVKMVAELICIYVWHGLRLVPDKRYKELRAQEERLAFLIAAGIDATDAYGVGMADWYSHGKYVDPEDVDDIDDEDEDQ